MYTILVMRYKEFPRDKDGSTLSEIAVRNELDGSIIFRCYGLEPDGPDTLDSNQDKRIPAGEYKVIWDTSSQTGVDICGKLPLIYNDLVPQSRRIRIHIGNYGKDTLGCLLLGMSANNNTGTISNSRAALTIFVNRFKDEEEMGMIITNDF